MRLLVYIKTGHVKSCYPNNIFLLGCSTPLPGCFNGFLGKLLCAGLDTSIDIQWDTGQCICISIGFPWTILDAEVKIGQFPYPAVTDCLQFGSSHEFCQWVIVRVNVQVLLKKRGKRGNLWISHTLPILDSLPLCKLKFLSAGIRAWDPYVSHLSLLLLA